MGTGTAAGSLMLGPSEVKAAILAGVGDYVIEETVLEQLLRIDRAGCSPNRRYWVQYAFSRVPIL